MKRRVGIISIVVVSAIFLILSVSDSPEKKDKPVFHITLAEPNLYTNGVYSKTLTIEPGEYRFRFVPNGSSPEILSIIIEGSSFDFSEDFKLKSTLHQTGISEYYTWKYEGQEKFEILESQKAIITINPNGNVLGSVTVDILEN